MIFLRNDGVKMSNGYYKRVYKGILSHLVFVKGNERHFYKIQHVDFTPTVIDDTKVAGDSYTISNDTLHTKSFYKRITREEYIKIKIKGGDL
jgi:hypothetical protein